jgi:hypothetical protein
LADLLANCLRDRRDPSLVTHSPGRDAALSDAGRRLRL